MNEFGNETRMVLEKSIMKNIPKLNERNVFSVLQSLQTNKIDNSLYYDLLAGQFVRAYPDTEEKPWHLYQRSTIFFQLVNGNTEPGSLYNTCQLFFKVYTEAALIVAKSKNADDVEVPQGLFNEGLESLIEKTAVSMFTMNKEEIVKTLTQLAWSTMILFHKKNEDSNELEFDTLGWNNYADFSNAMVHDIELEEITYDLMC